MIAVAQKYETNLHRAHPCFR